MNGVESKLEQRKRTGRKLEHIAVDEKVKMVEPDGGAGETGDELLWGAGSYVCKADEGVRNLLGKKVTWRNAWIRGEELQLDEHEEQRRIEPMDCE